MICKCNVYDVESSGYIRVWAETSNFVFNSPEWVLKIHNEFCRQVVCDPDINNAALRYDHATTFSPIPQLS